MKIYKMVSKRKIFRVLFFVVFVYSLLLNIIFLTITHHSIINLNISIWESFSNVSFNRVQLVRYDSNDVYKDITKNVSLTKSKQLLKRNRTQKFYDYQDSFPRNSTIYAPGLIVDWFPDVLVHPTLYNLKWHPLFPHMPSETSIMTSLTENEYIRKSFARRIYGFLIPDESADYEIEIGSRDGIEMILAELRTKNLKSFSKLFNKLNIKLNFSFSLEDMIEQDKIISENDIFKKIVNLKLQTSKVYFLDIIQGGWNYGRLNIKWRKRKVSQFQEITIPHIFHVKTMINRLHKQTLHQKHKPKKPLSKNEEIRMQYFSIPNFKINLTSQYRSCKNFKKQNISIDLYNGVSRLENWATYPDNLFGYYKPLAKSDLCMNETEAVIVVNKTMDVIREIVQQDLHLHNIVQVQKNFDAADKLLEERQFYFVEVDLSVGKNTQLQRLTTYVQLSNNAICIRNDFQWNENSKIYFLTPVRNQGYWVHHLINSLEKIIDSTAENNIELILVDFNSTDTNIEYLLKNHRVPYKYILQNDAKFNKVHGLNIALNHVEDDSIAFVMDLHLEVPNNLFDKIRKHTIRGISGYSPTLMKFNKGTHEQYYEAPPSGNDQSWLWLETGVGMISLYKSDWKAIGGMNEKSYGTTWGGEDWELVDRLLGNGYYLFHMRLPRFYHIYHSNKHLWDGNKVYSDFQN